MVVASNSWMDGALCTQTDPDLFTAEGAGGSWAEARKVCARCDVVEQCLQYALETRQTGFWGGKSQKQRTMLRRAS